MVSKTENWSPGIIVIISTYKIDALARESNSSEGLPLDSMKQCR